jgi:transposase
VRKPLGIKIFRLLPRHWAVERTFAWIVKCWRCDHDYGRFDETGEVMIKWAMIGLMVSAVPLVSGSR